MTSSSISRIVGIVVLLISAVTFLGGGIDFPDLFDGPDGAQPVKPDEPPSEMATALQAGFLGYGDSAAVWSGLLEGLARYVEADGKTNDPYVKSMGDLRALQLAAVTASPGGVYGGQVIGEALGPELDGMGLGELTPEKRAQVVGLFSQASKALEGVK